MIRQIQLKFLHHPFTVAFSKLDKILSQLNAQLILNWYLKKV